MAILLFGQAIIRGDSVYSDSMGSGKVTRLLPDDIGFFVSHGGQEWRYNSKLIRSGCNKSDLSWHQKPNGIQLRNKEDQTKAEAFLIAVGAEIEKAKLFN